MIKLISKELRVDLDTFAPMCRVTVDVPLEPMVDTQALEGKDALYMKIGQAFIESVEDGGCLLDLISELLKGGVE